jgi:hypothetical protein
VWTGLDYVRFQVLTAASMKFRVFLDVLPCSRVGVDRRFRGAYCLHHQGDESALLEKIAGCIGVQVDWADHYTSLSLLYYGLPTHLPLAHFLTYRHPFTIGQPSPLGLLYNLLPFRARLIALMTEAVRTSETSVNIYLTTWQYIPEDYKLD